MAQFTLQSITIILLYKQQCMSFWGGIYLQHVTISHCHMVSQVESQEKEQKMYIWE
jgi:hypothetical protein